MTDPCEHGKFAFEGALKQSAGGAEKSGLSPVAAYLSKTDIARIDNAIRSGLIKGLDSQQIARRVVGGMDRRGVDGVTEITRHQIKEVARTFFRLAKRGLRKTSKHG